MFRKLVVVSVLCSAFTLCAKQAPRPDPGKPLTRQQLLALVAGQSIDFGDATMSSGFSYQGPRVLLYRSVWVSSEASAGLLLVLHFANQHIPSDLSIGLLLISVEQFALDLGILASLVFLVLVFYRDVLKTIQLRAVAAAFLPYFAPDSLADGDRCASAKIVCAAASL